MKLRSGKDWHPSEEAIEDWKGAYKDVDVEQELKKMAVWCEANPAKRKTPSGVMKFCQSWLCRSQEQGGSSGSPSKYKKYEDSNSIRAKTIDMQLGDVTWVVDPQELMQFKQYLLNAYGYYYDGEIRYE